MTSDFLYQDRRSGPSFPDADAESIPGFIATIWQTGAGLPDFSMRKVVGVRGERFAAIVVRIEYANGMITESIQVIGLDASLRRFHRTVDFDCDDIAGAIAELDRLHDLANGT